MHYSNPRLCPMCNGKTKIKSEKVSDAYALSRKRECLICGYKYRTMEILEEEATVYDNSEA